MKAMIFIQVYFLGVNGSDGGGLTREFFSLMARHFTKYIEQTGCFKHNSLALHVMFGNTIRQWYV